MVFSARILAGQTGAGARHGDYLSDRIRRGRTAVPAPHRRARHAAGAAVSGWTVLLANTEHLSLSLFRSGVRRGLLVGCRVVGSRRRRCGLLRAVVGHDADLADAVGALPVHRQRRAGVVLIRLGVAAAGDRLPDDLPRKRAHRPADSDVVVGALAAVPGRIRCRIDQDARRLVLAQSDVPVLPPRNTAHAGPVELVLPSPA
ncbi:Uncharacterised protein [Mycobacterium tuberculosis]|uniref:Uncharacterized protein n=1 Tax=Mycobacterium tuberculosis TaxID=1773 RepID=A0A0T9EEQ9_MYCTX|nr:Uncharacterised protein [Mycobacterium tuberculosis]CFR83109.1 Uncharacterised protein [Mycobacterium tuberculosis]CKS59916.1 Uncharacterised protein [Mycobacterium tuberculosis]CKT08677.1 Uncharacterised protein [Mycobacterium tuberculosis]CKT53996.1 Uncharacterised protein [Mycobacterium tuberculosis]